MKLHKIKSFIGATILLAYIGMGVFGLYQMSHHESMVSVGDCPYALNSHALCKNVFNHISNWRAFSSVVFPALLVLSIVFFIVALYFFDRNKFLRQRLRLFHRWTQHLDDKFLYLYRRKIIYWLSLFENSPPVNVW